MVMGSPVAVIAGGGMLPAEAVRQMVLRGREVCAVSVMPGGARGLKRFGAARTLSVHLSELDECVKLLRAAGCSQAVIVGKVAKALMFSDQATARAARSLIGAAAGWQDPVILAAILRRLDAAGIELLEQTDVLNPWVCPAGDLTPLRPTAREREDAEDGLTLARMLGAAGVGQTVIMKNGVALAVEACEGTDAAVRRGARIARGGAVVAKAASPNHDFRFDVPTVGTRTLSVMHRWKASVLALEAGRTLIAEPRKFLKEAEDLGIAVTGCPGPGRAQDAEAMQAGRGAGGG